MATDEVIDGLLHPAAACASEEIVTPTLLEPLPRSLRRIVGDPSGRQVLAGSDISFASTD